MKKFQRTLRKKKKLVAKKSKFLIRHPFVVPVTVFIGLFFLGIFGFISLGASTQGAADARIVNVYVDGEQQTVTTRARTVAELLGRLEIPLADEDIVEPAKDSLILEDDTQINIYRARPVEIVDGERTITITTAQRAPRLVAKQANIVLLPEDEARFARREATVLESAIAEQLEITRSVEVTLNVYGAIKTLRTTAESIEKLLSDEGVLLAEGETVQPSVEGALTPGMLVSVNKPGVVTEVTTEPIPFSVEQKNDDTLEAGKSAVSQAGIAGERAIIYKLLPKEDGTTEKKIIQEVVVRQPVNEVRLRGIKIVTPRFNSTQTVSGDKAALMAAAGISEQDFPFVDYIVTKESQWRPGVANSSSGAYGLCQALPASKMSSAGADYLTNPITQLRWCSGYASGRYGGWSGAYSAWLVQGWW